MYTTRTWPWVLINLDKKSHRNFGYTYHNHQGFIVGIIFILEKIRKALNDSWSSNTNKWINWIKEPANVVRNDYHQFNLTCTLLILYWRLDGIWLYASYRTSGTWTRGLKFKIKSYLKTRLVDVLQLLPTNA